MAAPKPVVVRVKRKAFHSPLDAFWLEINDRPIKRPILNFHNLSISDHVQIHNKKVLVQHVDTITTSQVTLDILHSFLDPASKPASQSHRNNLFKKLNVNPKQQKQSSAKEACFQQIWKSRKLNKGTSHQNALQQICHFYDILRVDSEEQINKAQHEHISLEDQKLLSSFPPLLREVIPNAAAEIKLDISAHSKQEDYVYDLYTITDETINEESSSHSYPLVQVDDEDYCDGPGDSDYESDDSNDENHPMNDYPEEISEDDEGSDCESDESEHSKSSSELSVDDDKDEDDGHHDFAKGGISDPLYDEDFDDYDGQGVHNDDNDDMDNEHLKWSYR